MTKYRERVGYLKFTTTKVRGLIKGFWKSEKAFEMAKYGTIEHSFSYVKLQPKSTWLITAAVKKEIHVVLKKWKKLRNYVRILILETFYLKRFLPLRLTLQVLKCIIMYENVIQHISFIKNWQNSELKYARKNTLIQLWDSKTVKQVLHGQTGWSNL